MRHPKLSTLHWRWIPIPSPWGESLPKGTRLSQFGIRSGWELLQRLASPTPSCVGRSGSSSSTPYTRTAVPRTRVWNCLSSNCCQRSMNQQTTPSPTTKQLPKSSTEMPKQVPNSSSMVPRGRSRQGSRAIAKDLVSAAKALVEGLSKGRVRKRSCSATNVRKVLDTRSSNHWLQLQREKHESFSERVPMVWLLKPTLVSKRCGDTKGDTWYVYGMDLWTTVQGMQLTIYIYIYSKYIYIFILYIYSIIK